MTDEKLDQILKQALAPEISDREIRIHRRRKDKMNKFGKIGKCVAAVVAAAVIGIADSWINNALYSFSCNYKNDIHITNNVFI